MIKSIRLQNFQSHKDTLLEFDSGVNVITGQSSSGKTSIIRALRWVTENRPLGDSIRSNFTEEDTVVTVKTTDGHTVVKTRGKSVNNYEVNGQKYEAAKTTVPQEVLDALNLEPVNIQYQMDQPFLLSNGSGEVAQFINKVVNIDVIDLTISNINKKLKKVNQEASGISSAIEENESILETFSILDPLDEKVASIESKTVRLEEVSSKSKALIELLDNILSIDKKIQTKEEFLQRITPSLKSCRSLKLTLSNLSKTLVSLSSSIRSLKVSSKTIEELKKGVVNPKRIKDLSRRNERLEKISTKKRMVNDILAELKGLDHKISRLKIERDTANDDYQKAIPDTCPTCKQKWKNKRVPLRVR